MREPEGPRGEGYEKRRPASEGAPSARTNERFPQKRRRLRTEWAESEQRDSRLAGFGRDADLALSRGGEQCGTLLRGLDRRILKRRIRAHDPQEVQAEDAEGSGQRSEKRHGTVREKRGYDEFERREQPRHRAGREELVQVRRQRVGSLRKLGWTQPGHFAPRVVNHGAERCDGGEECESSLPV